MSHSSPPASPKKNAGTSRSHAKRAVVESAPRLRPEREVQVREREHEEDRPERGEGVEPRGKAPQVDRLEPEATEPEEVGEERDERTDEDRDEQEQEQQDCDEDVPARGT
jgi:hypothetical protein